MSDRQDIRECFVPRAGCVYAVADYSQLELFALAQVCLDLFGKSHLAEVLNAGQDPHTMLAADLLGITYDEASRRKKDGADKEFFLARQAGKSANFGFACGLGPAKMVEYSRKAYDTIVPLEDIDGHIGARSLRQAWFRRWPEMELYFVHVNECMRNPKELGTVEIPRTRMRRAGLTFTETANTFYQGLGAAAAKCAAWEIAKACYVQEDSPVFGSRVCNFVHDEFILETTDCDGAHEVAEELARLMRLGAVKMMPDCVPGVEPLLCRYWSKSAKPVFENGRLVPWPQEKKSA